MIPFSIVQQAHSAGLSIVPPQQDGTKRPSTPWRDERNSPTWKPAQTTAPSLALLKEWYDPKNDRTGIGVVCGRVSGGLEVLDFDTREGWIEYRQMAEHCGIAPLIDRIWAGYGEESPRGAHLMYRCAEIDGNTKLAKKAGQKTAFIESRGEGGYVIIAPSHGRVHPSGAEYRCVSGSLATLTTITPLDRRDLWELAQSLDESPRPLPASDPLQSSRDPANKPGADFNRRATWAEVLEPHGWRAIHQRGEVTYWRRPNKTAGISATTGYGGDYLYAFTTSTELDSECTYTKFGAYSALNHGGDFFAATAALGRMGYGDPPRAPDAPRPQLRLVAPEEPLPDADEAPLWQGYLDEQDADLPTACLEIPFGCGPDLVRYLLESSLHPNPVFAVQTARAFLAAVLSRRHVSSQRNFANLFTVLIGKTAIGKEDSKHQLENLLTACGLERMLIGKGYSHPSAIYSALQDEPKHVALIDEMGMYLREQKNANSSINLLLREFMELYGRAHGLHHAPRLSALGLSKADRDTAKSGRLPIIKPALNLVAMSTPETFWGAIARDHLDNGFLNRFLLVESYAPRAVMADFRAVPIPESVVEWARWATGADNPLTYAQQFTYDLEPPLILWTLTPQAKAAAREFEQRMLDWADAWNRELPGLGNLVLRVNENSLRVALQNAALDGDTDFTVTDRHLSHAQQYVETHARRAGASLRRHLVATPFEANRNIILEAIRSKGEKGITEYEMARSAPFTRFNEKELRELLDSLAKGWLIAFLNVRDGKPGRKREAWTALDPEKTAEYCEGDFT